MVSDAPSPGSDKRLWGTAHAAGPAGRLGRPSVSDPWGVVCCHLSLGRPGCACVCGVHGPLALVQRCACTVWCVLGVPCVRCPWPLCACSLVCVLSVLCVWCLWLLWGYFFVFSCLVLPPPFCVFFCAVCVSPVAPWGLLFCVSWFFLSFFPQKRRKKKGGGRVCAHNRHKHGLRVAVLHTSLWVIPFLSLARLWRPRPRGGARMS